MKHFLSVLIVVVLGLASAASAAVEIKIHSTADIGHGEPVANLLVDIPF